MLVEWWDLLEIPNLGWGCVELPEARSWGSGWTRSQKQASIITDRRTSLPILPDIFLACSRGSHENPGKPSTFSIWTVVYRNGSPLKLVLTASQTPSFHAPLQRLASTYEHGFGLTANITANASNCYHYHAATSTAWQ